MLSLALAAFVLGVVFFVAAAYYRVKKPPQERTYLGIIGLDVFRSLGALLCSLAVLSILIYIPLISSFLSMLGEKVGAVTLRSLVPAPVAEQVEKYIIEDKVFYGDLHVRYNLDYDRENQECLVGTELMKTTVHNTSGVEDVKFLLKVDVSDLSIRCARIAVKSVKVFEKEDGILLWQVPKTRLEAIRQVGQSCYWDTTYVIKKNSSIFVEWQYDIRVEKAKDRVMVRPSHPTKSLTMEVMLPKDFEAGIRFSHPAAKERPHVCVQSVLDNHYIAKIKCALLPYQSAEIYWPPE